MESLKKKVNGEVTGLVGEDLFIFIFFRGVGGRSWWGIGGGTTCRLGDQRERKRPREITFLI